ncbi:MAG TPA: hypothetical protein VF682_21980 [Pseudomonas sp.]|jgi:hypothetical protein
MDVRLADNNSIFDGCGSMLRASVLAVVFVVIGGCASEAAPNYYNGGYYMAGDPSCVQMSPLTASRIKCYDSDGVVTGYREAMSSQDIQMYQYGQAQQTQQMQQLNQSMQQTNQSIQQNTQMYPQYQQYTAPAVTPITPPGGNQVRCISTDIYTNCRY